MNATNLASHGARRAAAILAAMGGCLAAEDAPRPGASSNESTAAAEPAAAPRIEFVETSHDLGEVLGAKAATHTFRFRNTGSALLRIEHVGSS